MTKSELKAGLTTTLSSGTFYALFYDPCGELSFRVKVINRTLFLSVAGYNLNDILAHFSHDRR